jgi:hypothetical protein
MPKRILAARAIAEQYRALAEVGPPAQRDNFMQMAEWWENRALELEIEMQEKASN